MNNSRINYRLDEIGFGALRIYQDPADFCYGVDAVILSDFAAKAKGKRIIDLGCGNGIIPIILSHKTKESCITGVEIKKEAYELAKLNIELNHLEDRIRIVNEDIMNLSNSQSSQIREDEMFEVVVTNPPYMARGKGLVNRKKTGKMIARHETTANLHDFTRIASRLLVDSGELYMVHRPQRTVEIINSMTQFNLEPKIIRYVSPKFGEKPNIMLIQATKNGGSEVEIREPLYIYNDDGTYSNEIMKIYERM
jgi:tRNA1Val (adenine37-N6)-methyltransferase